MKEFSVDEVLDKNNLELVRKTYQNEGIILVRNVFSESETEQPIHDLLGLFASGFEMSDFKAGSFDEQYEKIWQTNSEVARLSLTLGRDLPSFMNLITDMKIRSIVQILLESSNLIVPYDWCLFRIDGQSTKVSYFDWHQDYPYNVINRSAITFWVPLSDVESNMGTLEYIPNSHRSILPVSPSKTITTNNPNRLPIYNVKQLSEKWEKEKKTTGPVNRGDLLLFNSLLVHRSGINTSNKYRWIANGRYGTTDDQELIRRNYYMARTKYPNYFGTAHPDLVINDESK